MALGHAEDRAQDHLERDLLHRRVHGERLAHGPARQLTLGGVGDDGLVGAHAVAVERRQHRLAARQVVDALQQQQRARADQRPQRGRAARRQPVRALRVQRADRSGEESITSGVLKPVKLTLNASPKRRRQSSMNAIGRSEPARGLERRRRRSARRGASRLAVPAQGGLQRQRRGQRDVVAPRVRRDLHADRQPAADVPQRTVAAGQPVSECEVV